MEHETRGAVGEPADVFECFPHEAAGFPNEAAMKGALEGMNPGEDDALGRLGVKKREPLLIYQIADEEAGGWPADRRLSSAAASHFALRHGRSDEPVTSQAAIFRCDGPIALQIRRCKLANPYNRADFGNCCALSALFCAAPNRLRPRRRFSQRPSKGYRSPARTAAATR